MSRRYLNEEEIKRVIDMAKDHIPVKEIARLFGITEGGIYNILRSFGAPSPFVQKSRSRSGWRKLSPTEEAETSAVVQCNTAPATLDLSVLTPEAQAGYLSMYAGLQAKLDIANQQAAEAKKLWQEELEKVAKLTQKIELLEELIGEITVAE